MLCMANVKKLKNEKGVTLTELLAAIVLAAIIGIIGYNILFSGFSGKKHKGDHQWKRKWDNMTDEERTRFRQEWWKRCGKMPDESKWQNEMKSENERPQQ